MSRKRPRSPSPSNEPKIYKSDPIEDRSSKFVAVFSPNLSSKSLQEQSEFKSASHRIAAWRKPGSQRSLNSQNVLDIGHEDDGEKYGGKTLEKMLIERNVEGSVIVARWYGGILLGPVRFDHIRTCANDAISQWVDDTERRAKKARKESLIGVLRERDESIAVLRDLLSEKKKEKQGFSSSSSAKGMDAAKTQDYSTVELPVLERLENVRDKTIGWILAEIEKAESAQIKSPSMERQEGKSPQPPNE